MSKVALFAWIVVFMLGTHSPAHALVETGPEIEEALTLTLAPASLAAAAIIVNAIELAEGRGSPPYAVALGLSGALAALVGGVYGLGISDDFFGDRERTLLLASTITLSFATASTILAIIGAVSYEPDPPPLEPAPLALYVAPSIGAHDASLVVLGGF